MSNYHRIINALQEGPDVAPIWRRLLQEPPAVDLGKEFHRRFDAAVAGAGELLGDDELCYVTAGESAAVLPSLTAAFLTPHHLLHIHMPQPTHGIAVYARLTSLHPLAYLEAHAVPATNSEERSTLTSLSFKAKHGPDMTLPLSGPGFYDQDAGRRVFDLLRSKLT